MPFPPKLIPLCKQIATADQSSKIDLIGRLDKEIGHLYSNEKDILKLKIAAYAAAGLFEQVEKLNERDGKVILSDDDLIYSYAVGGHHEKVKKCLKDDNLDAVASGYAAGGYDEHVVECIKNGANISQVAVGYAIVGRHDKVKHCLSCGASADDVFDAYGWVGNIPEEKHFKPVDNLNKFTFTPHRNFNHFRLNTASPKNYTLHKIRINITPKTFNANAREIGNLIKDLALEYPSVIHSFKWITPFSGSLYEAEKAFWSAMNNKDPKQVRKVYEKYIEVYEKYPEVQEKRSNIVYGQKEDIRKKTIKFDLKKELKAAKEADDSYRRLLNKFTLYLDERHEIVSVKSFVSVLAARLREAGFIPGRVADTDVPINDFISLRQERLKDEPKTYIAAHEAKSSTIKQLKKEAKESELYKALVETNTLEHKKEAKELVLDKVSVDAELKKIHRNLVELTDNYLSKHDFDPSKKKTFEDLREALGDKEKPTLGSVIAFKKLLEKADEGPLETHRTSTWKRYVYNVFSVLTVLPAIIRACSSYSQYGSFRFWQSDSKKAFKGIKDEVKKSEDFKVPPESKGLS